MLRQLDALTSRMTNFLIPNVMKRYVFLIITIAMIVATMLFVIGCDREPQEEHGGIVYDAVTDFDGNSYDGIWIGNQLWMKENLRTTHYADGSSIPLGGSASIEPCRYCPNNIMSNVNVYGYLYNWPAVMNCSSSSDSNPSGVQGICPNGWHVPSDEEWTQMTSYVKNQNQFVCGGSSVNIAKALASQTGWNHSVNICAVGNNQNENNAAGFTAFPAGYFVRYCCNFGDGAGFWSSTALDDYLVWDRYLYYNDANVYRNGCGMDVGYSVRCVRD